MNPDSSNSMLPTIDHIFQMRQAEYSGSIYLDEHSDYSDSDRCCNIMHVFPDSPKNSDNTFEVGQAKPDIDDTMFFYDSKSSRSDTSELILFSYDSLDSDSDPDVLDCITTTAEQRSLGDCAPSLIS